MLDRYILPRHTVIGDNRLRYILVRHDDNIVAHRLKRRKSPRYIRYLAFLTGAETHIIVQTYLLGQNKVHTGKNIGKRILKCQSHRHTADPQSCQDRCDGNAVILQYYQYAHSIDYKIDYIVEQRRLRHVLVGTHRIKVDDTGKAFWKQRASM